MRQTQIVIIYHITSKIMFIPLENVSKSNSKLKVGQIFFHKVYSLNKFARLRITMRI